MNKVLIGIQARSGSTRLPRKAYELIGGRMMMDRVIEIGKAASKSITSNGRFSATVAVLTPTGDPIATDFKTRGVEIVEGPEQDVLARYAVAVERFEPDWIIRITGDCPMLPPNVVNSVFHLAVKSNYDYISNVDERCRTSMDGTDCEVISRRLFDHISRHAVAPHDREHVTPLCRGDRPHWATAGIVIAHFDLSDLKYSVDTPEDLARVRAVHEQAYAKYQEACGVYGFGKVHRIA